MSTYQKSIFLIISILLIAISIRAQKIIPIESSSNALVLSVNDEKDVSVVYFGEKLANQNEYESISGAYRQANDFSQVLNLAYTPAGSKNLMEPAITVKHADGNTSLVLKYVDHSVEKIDEHSILYTINLKDPVYPFFVKLYYKAFVQEDIIEQWSVINHKENGDVRLDKFASANLYLKADEFWLTHYHGDWAQEMNPELTKLTHGIKTLDTKLGTRANLLQPSVFMIGLDGAPQEDEGTVMYGAMEWSGNFRIDFELDYQDNLRLIAGMNNFASSYSLKPNEEFETPKFLYLLSHNGKGEASRKMHRWARKYKVLSMLGRGWEGEVYKIKEVTTNIERAAKIFFPILA